MFEGWDKLLSVEELLPKASQQAESALTHATNRCSCPLQSSQALMLGAGLAIVILVILFVLTHCKIFMLPLLFVAGLVFWHGVGFQRGWGTLFFLLGSCWARSSETLGCQRVLAVLQGGCREGRSSRSCSLAWGSCSPCWLQLTKSWAWLKPWLEIRPLQAGGFPWCLHTSKLVEKWLLLLEMRVQFVTGCGCLKLAQHCMRA